MEDPTTVDLQDWTPEDLSALSEAFKAGSDYMKAARAKEAKAKASQQDTSRVIPVSDMGQGLRGLAQQAQKGKRR